jgi:hypothetical protein
MESPAACRCEVENRVEDDRSPVTDNRHDDVVVEKPWEEMTGRERSLANLRKPKQPHRGPRQSTIEKWAVVDMIFGEPDSPESIAMCASLRQQLMNGTLAPGIAVFLLGHWLGKVKDRIEVSGDMTLTKIVREIVDVRVSQQRELPDVDHE